MSLKVRFLYLLLLVTLTVTAKTNAQSFEVDIQVPDKIQAIEYNPIYELLAVALPSEVLIYNSDIELVDTISRNLMVGSLTDVAWSPDGQKIAITDDPDVEIWAYNAENGLFNLERTINPSNPDFIFSGALAWESVLIIGYHYQIQSLNQLLGYFDVIDTSTWTVVSSIGDARNGFVDLTPSMVASPSGSELLTGDFYCLLDFSESCSGLPSAFTIDLSSSEITWSQNEFGTNIHDVAWSLDGVKFAYAASKVFIFDATTKELLYAWDINYGNVTFIEWSTDSNYLLVALENGYIAILDTQTFMLVNSFQTVSLPTQISQMDWDSASESLFIGTWDGISDYRLQLWSTAH